LRRGLLPSPAVQGSALLDPPEKEKGERPAAFPLFIGYARCALRRSGVTSSRQAGLGFFNELGKTRLVEDSDVRQGLAVEVNVGLLQSVHETAVRHAVHARARIDARDPQAAEDALLVATITVGVLARLDHRLLGDAEDLATRVVITLGLAQHLAVARPGDGASLDSCHDSS